MKEKKETNQLIGRIINGGYEVGSLIASGGFASVYHGRDRQGRNVALKISKAPVAFRSSTLINDPHKPEREAQIQLSLHHENILPVYWFGVERYNNREYPFLVMKHASEGSLSDHLEEGVPLAPGEALDFLLQAANGVQAAHDEGVIHGDLKSDNLLLDFDKKSNSLVVLISDFGGSFIAPADIDATQQLHISITKKYAAPEQIREDGQVSKATDQYSLGIIAFRLLAGKVPFYGKTFDDYIFAHNHLSPPSFQEVCGDTLNPILRALEPVVRRALEKDPKKRYASVIEFAQALKEAYDQVTGVQWEEPRVDAYLAHLERKRKSLERRRDELIANFEEQGFSIDELSDISFDLATIFKDRGNMPNALKARSLGHIYTCLAESQILTGLKAVSSGDLITSLLEMQPELYSAIKFDPNNPHGSNHEVIRNEKNEVGSSEGLKKSLLKKIDTLIALNPESWNNQTTSHILYLKGNILSLFGDYRGAANAYTEAVARNRYLLDAEKKRHECLKKTTVEAETVIIPKQNPLNQ